MGFYRYFIELVSMFSDLGAWQRRALALWCSGVVSAERCQLGVVADVLSREGHGASAAVERRLGRFLANRRISDEGLSRIWIQQVVRQYASHHWIVLVDETKLGNHLGVMMVSLAYHGRAIPLVWRCYRLKAYPIEGQVCMIMELLHRLRRVIPAQITLTLQADRGIGTSPTLMRQLDASGWQYLLRVQSQVRVRLRNGTIHSLKSLVRPGEVWYGHADVFRKAGWLKAYIYLDWRLGEASPWCLVSNSPWRRSSDYAQRSWQEQSFRDLKSFGFNWQDSQVWTPAHAWRLLFILTLAYSWVIAQAHHFTVPDAVSPSRTHPRHSVFQRGLRWIRRQLPHCSPYLSPQISFVPDSPLLC